MGIFGDLKAGIRIGKIELLAREIYAHIRNFDSFNSMGQSFQVDNEKVEIISKMNELYSLSEPLSDRASQLPIKTPLMPGGRAVLSLFLIGVVMELYDLELRHQVSFVSEKWKLLFVKLCNSLPHANYVGRTFEESVRYLNDIARNEGFLG